MIITRIIPGAGLGNQMFMYAAGLAAAMRLNTDLKISAWDFPIITRKDRPYYLNCFPEIKEPLATLSETFRLHPMEALVEYLTVKIPSRYALPAKIMFKVIAKFIIPNRYRPSFLSYSPEFLSIKDNSFITGYWESEKIFADIADTVRRKFKFAPEYYDTELSERIKSCNSVALHVRRGDKANSLTAIPSNESYIKLAVEKLLSLTENPEFFVFSDDIEWCRKNLPLIYDAEYTFIEGQTPAQDMALMSICRHVIIGPSTFSWWGAWLNEYPGKIVIAPALNRWYNPGTYNPDDRKHLLPERWIKIS